MKYPVTRFKSLEIALKEIEPFVRNGMHFQTGKPFKQLDGMRSREVLANWLLCVTADAADGRQLTFSSDPTGSDGIIQDGATGQTWPTEHVYVPRQMAGEAGTVKSTPYATVSAAEAARDQQGHSKAKRGYRSERYPSNHMTCP